MNKTQLRKGKSIFHNMKYTEYNKIYDESKGKKGN